MLVSFLTLYVQYYTFAVYFQIYQDLGFGFSTLIQVLICLRCNFAARPPVLPGILFQYKNRSRRQHWSSQSLPPACLRSWLVFNFAGMPAVKICDGSLLPGAHAVLICPNSSPSSRTGGYVSGTSAAYENQALQNMLTYGVSAFKNWVLFCKRAQGYETVVFRDRRKCIKYNFRVESARY